MKLLDWLSGRAAEQLSPQQFLAEVQQENPPLLTNGGDLGQRIHQRLVSRLPGGMRALFAKGDAVIGEVGLLSPNALAEFVPPHGYAIRVYTGLGHLFHTIGRILMTAATVQSESGIQPRTRTQPEATDLIARLCNDLKRGEPVPAPGDFGLTETKLKMATELASGAEDFVIAHEYGHMAEWLKRGGNPGAISPDEEYAADRHALETVLGIVASWPVQKRLDHRGAYAGAEFALRVFGSLEHLNYEFERTHPLPGGRLKRLRETARAVVGSRFRFIEISTIAFASDQQLEEMERAIAGDTKAARFVVGVTADRMLSTLSVLIEAAARGQLSLDETAERCARELDGLPADLLQTIALQVTEMYEVEALQTAHLRNVQLRVAEVEAFKALKPRLPALFSPRQTGAAPN
jgi:hypothetical protein